MECTKQQADFNKAKDLASDLLKKYCIDQPPVVAKELAEMFRLNVVPVNFQQINPEYSGISGFIDSQTNRLFVNSNESAVRRNFTIAHELGHYLFGHTSSSEYANLLFRRPLEEQEDPIIEQEANCFAANLLVPEQFLKDIIKKYPFANNQQLGNIFGVSDTVIRIRRKILGI